MNIKIDISVCRVCLQPGAGQNIYTGDILEKFVYTTLVQVGKQDGLSEIICKKCVARLRVAYEFKKQAESSDRHLRSFISDVNRKFKQVTGKKTPVKSCKSKKVWTKTEENQSSDDLDDDINALLNEEDDEGTFSAYEAVDEKNTIPREQLVEILGESSSNIRKTVGKQSIDYIEDANYGVPQEMEVFLIDDQALEDGCIVEGIESDEYDESASLSANEYTETTYLEYDGNDDVGLVQGVKPTRHSKINTSESSSSNPMNRCNKCNKTFSTRTNLTRHMITHEGRKPYVCQICGNSFTQNGSLKSHMYIHTGERPYQCTECPKAFTQSKSLTFHMRRHTGEKPFNCEHCGVQFRQKDGLKRHIAAKHLSVTKKVYKCEVCDKELLSKYSLNIHRTKHSDWKMDKDEERNESENENENESDTIVVVKSENSKEQEDAEMKEVWEDQAYACEFCEEVFPTVDEMIQHRSVHEENNTKAE